MLVLRAIRLIAVLRGSKDLVCVIIAFPSRSLMVDYLLEALTLLGLATSAQSSRPFRRNMFPRQD